MKLEKTARQTLLLYASTLLSVLLGIACSILNTRSLPPAEYGDVRYVQNILNLFSCVLFFGVFFAGSRMLAVSQDRNSSSGIRGTLILFLGALSLVAVLFTVTLAYIPHNAKIRSLLLFSSLVSMQPLLASYTDNVFIGDNHIGRLSLARVLPKVLYVVIAFFCFREFGATSTSMMLLQWGLYVVIFLILIFSTSPSFGNIRENARQLFKENKEYGNKIYIGTIVSVATNYLAGVTLGMVNSDNTMVGFYTLALTVTYPLSTLPAIVGSSFFKRFASESRISGKVMLWTASLTLLTMVAFVFLIKPVVILFYTEQYKEVAVLSQWMSLSFCLHGFGDFLKGFLTSHAQGSIIMKSCSAAGAIKLVGYLVLVYFFNTAGALVTLIVSEMIYCGLLALGYRRYVNSNNV